MKIKILSTIPECCLTINKIYQNIQPNGKNKYKDHPAGVWIKNDNGIETFLPCERKKSFVYYEIIEP